MTLADILRRYETGFPLPSGLLERFVLRNGTAFPALAKRPKGVRMAKQGQCYANAARLALRGVGTYCEGFALRNKLPIPIQHAWVNVDGQALDNTWRNVDRAEYIGVEFTNEILTRGLLRTKVYGILATYSTINIGLIEEIDPALMRNARAAIDARIKQRKAG